MWLIEKKSAPLQSVYLYLQTLYIINYLINANDLLPETVYTGHCMNQYNVHHR